MDGETPGGGGSACILRTAANDPANSVYLGGSVDRGQNLAALIGSSCCQRAATVLPTLPPVNPADYIALPAAKDEPCHVCGRRPMSLMVWGGGALWTLSGPCYNLDIDAVEHVILEESGKGLVVIDLFKDLLVCGEHLDERLLKEVIEGDADVLS